MAHFGIITAPATGHVIPFTFLSKELIKKGHKVTFFNIADVKERVTQEGIDFCTIGEKYVPLGAMGTLQKELANQDSFVAMRTWQRHNLKLIQLMYAFLPNSIRKNNIDFLLVDQSDACGGSIAESLSIPYITMAIGNSLMWDTTLPPVFSNWKYVDDEFSKKRNYVCMDKIINIEMKPLRDVINKYREKHQLPPHTELENLFPVSSLAHICQLPKFLDFPRKEVPDSYFNVGPFHGRFSTPIDFPYDLLDGRPIIYVSLGTVVNSRPYVFKEIVKACEGIDLQIVISTSTTEALKELEEEANPPLIVPFAPQKELMRNAKLCITHAGLNTVMDALENGVPMVSIPISFDQPGTGSRIEYHQIGKVVNPNHISTDTYLKDAIHEVLKNPIYRQNAMEMKAKFEELDGMATAIDIIEWVQENGKPASRKDWENNTTGPNLGQ